MDINECIFTGKASWHKEYRIPGQSWGNITIRIDLPNFSVPYKNKLRTIDRPIIWLNVKSEYKDNLLLKRERILLESINDSPFLLVRSAKIVDFKRARKDANGNIIESAPKEVVFKVEVSPAYVVQSATPLPTLNTSIISGVVSEMTSSGYLTIESAYRSKSGTKVRKVPILIDPTRLPTGIVPGTSVFIYGSLCGRTPSGEDGLFVYADHLIKTS